MFKDWEKKRKKKKIFQRNWKGEYKYQRAQIFIDTHLEWERDVRYFIYNGEDSVISLHKIWVHKSFKEYKIYIDFENQRIESFVWESPLEIDDDVHFIIRL